MMQKIGKGNADYVREAMTPPKDQAPGLVARFDPLWSLDEMLECAEGQYVRATDHDARIEQLEVALKEVTSSLEDYRSRSRKIAYDIAMKADRAAALASVALTKQANIRSPAQSQIKERFDPR